MDKLQVPVVVLNSGHNMPAIGFGTASTNKPQPDELTSIFVQAIAQGYRHIDTASIYETEECVGRAVKASLNNGLIENRDQVFITSKLALKDNHKDMVLPALKESLRKLGIEYLDLYLIHWPVRVGKKVINTSEITGEDSLHSEFSNEESLHFDIHEVWKAMEECQKLGLTKSIGVSNFSCAKLSKLLENATITPAVNQVEMSITWQQQRMVQFCKDRTIQVCAWSPLGASILEFWGSPAVMKNSILDEIAVAKNKSKAQVALRWVHEQGVVVLVKSYNNERMRENLQIFDWKLSPEENAKIAMIPQIRGFKAEMFVNSAGQYKTVEELWDGEI